MTQPYNPSQNPNAAAANAQAPTMAVPMTSSAPVAAPYSQQASAYAGGPAPYSASAPQAGAPYAPQGGYAPVGQDSLFGNLMNTTRAFAVKYGNALFIVALVGYGLGWLFDLITVLMSFGGYGSNTGRTVVSLLATLFAGAAKAMVQLFIFRMIIELVRNTAPRGEGPQA
ncbi:hypothetical protein [Actinomyces sp. oral taxon 897]|jgi:hypothetical protein|uniref:hypothetical protein n=1 Tax=Actinomyces sp. oral taxon 897 TaxID=2081702 RepID=UPI000D02AB6F|nr:hypothetical protein [Actinomyces sp. oral taxon 897]AVM61956.1 hypothetical protein C3V41_07655 [Actinomyces sp. oral taxon 897]